ncbi:hypothetical protein ACFYYN_24580 [Streptomyces sp. NPDC001902]
MTDGPLQPYHPDEGWTAPPGRQGVPGVPRGRRHVVLGRAGSGGSGRCPAEAGSPAC